MKIKRYSTSKGMNSKVQTPYNALRLSYHANPPNQFGGSSHSIQINEIFIGFCPEFEIKYN